MIQNFLRENYIIMKQRFKFFIVIAMILLFASQSCADEVQDLLNFYVKKFNPEKALLIISDKPDSSGMFHDIYMDLQGVHIDKLRLANLTFRMKGIQFNEPSNWKSGNVVCKSALQVLATSTILESDINKSIENKTFGKGEDHWHDVSLKINPSGLSGKGYYNAKVGFMNLDILIDITSKLKIVKHKELWLDNPLVKINRLDLPDYITNKALSRIQPLVNLNKFPLPLTLNTVKLSKGRAVLSSRNLPKPIEGGIKYNYSR